jgi:hypothetical protein
MRDELHIRSSTSACGVYKGANITKTLPKLRWNDVARLLEQDASSLTQTKIKALLRDAKTVRALYLTNTEAGYIVNTTEGYDCVVEVKFACAETQNCRSEGEWVPAYKMLSESCLEVHKPSEERETNPCGWCCVDRDVGWSTLTTTLKQDNVLVAELAKAFQDDPEKVTYVMSSNTRRHMANMKRSIYKVVIDRTPHFFQLMTVGRSAQSKTQKTYPLIVLKHVQDRDDDDVLDSLCHYTLSPERELKAPYEERLKDAPRDSWYKRENSEDVYVFLSKLVQSFQNCPVPDFDVYSSASVGFPLVDRHDQLDRSGWHGRLWPERDSWFWGLFSEGKSDRLFVPVQKGSGSRPLRPLETCQVPDMSTRAFGTLVGHRGNDDGSDELCVRVQDYREGDIDRTARLPHHRSVLPWRGTEKSLQYVSLDDCVCVLRRAPSATLEVRLLSEVLSNLEHGTTTVVDVLGKDESIDDIFYKLGVALAHMHLQGVYHGDVRSHTVLVVRAEEDDSGYRLMFVGFGTNSKLFNVHNYMLSYGDAAAILTRNENCVGAHPELRELVNIDIDAMIGQGYHTNVKRGYDDAVRIGFETRQPHIVNISKANDDTKRFEIQYHFERHANSCNDPLLDMSPEYDDPHEKMAKVPDGSYAPLSTLRRNAWGALQRKYRHNHTAYREESEPVESRFLVTATPGVVVTDGESLMTARIAPTTPTLDESNVDFWKGTLCVTIDYRSSRVPPGTNEGRRLARLTLVEVNDLFREVEESRMSQDIDMLRTLQTLWQLRHMSLAEYFRFQCVLGRMIQSSSTIDSGILSLLCTLALDITKQWTTDSKHHRSVGCYTHTQEENNYIQKFLVFCNFEPKSPSFDLI